MQILIPAQDVRARVRELAHVLAADYGRAGVVAIGVLSGAVRFMMDLLGTLPEDLAPRIEYDFIDAKSYQGTRSAGKVWVGRDPVVGLSGRDVLVVDGIVDTGRTLEAVLARLGGQAPRTLRTCTLLDKPSRRQVQVPVDYVGFGIQDVFAVGYGLDHQQRFRSLPYIAVLDEPEGDGRQG